MARLELVGKPWIELCLKLLTRELAEMILHFMCVAAVAMDNVNTDRRSWWDLVGFPKVHS